MLVRPLLHVGRDEIRAYLAALGQPYRDDASNADTAQTRARIRHDLLPRLARDYNPRVADALVRLGALAGAAEREREASLTELERAVVVSSKNDQVILKRPVLKRAPGISRPRSSARSGAAWAGPRPAWTGGAGGGSPRWRGEARCGPRSRGVSRHVTDDLFVVLRRVGPAPAQAPAPCPGRRCRWNSPEKSPGAEVASWRPSTPTPPCDERIDLDTLVPPLLVRGPADGDRFEPLGMDGRSTPLNDFFRGRGVWRDRRGRCSPGLRPARDRLGRRPPDRAPRPPDRGHDAGPSACGSSDDSDAIPSSCD